MTINSDDILEVNRLVATYNDKFDSNQVDEWLKVFVDDATFVTRDGKRVTGHDALRKWFFTRNHNSMHVTTDHVMYEDETLVKHRCTVIVFQRETEGISLRSMGVYEDVVAKTERGWRFVERAPKTVPVIGFAAPSQ